MPRQIDALILDDDVWSLRLMRGMLGECFPDLQVQVREQPDADGAFDIYFIDNDFNGELRAVELATRIRDREPEALIIAFSGNLDADSLKALINAGCDGAFDKTVPEDLSRAMEATRTYIEHRQSDRVQADGLRATLRSVRELLREWNTRLERQDPTAN
ncbi:MAG: response regulator [Planctomycetota bacterium]|jgi:DNA-binding NtrC family response regulator